MFGNKEKEISIEDKVKAIEEFFRFFRSSFHFLGAVSGQTEQIKEAIKIFNNIKEMYYKSLKGEKI
jgi:hypothetical protein